MTAFDPRDIIDHLRDAETPREVAGFFEDLDVLPAAEKRAVLLALQDGVMEDFRARRLFVPEVEELRAFVTLADAKPGILVTAFAQSIRLDRLETDAADCAMKTALVCGLARALGGDAQDCIRAYADEMARQHPADRKTVNGALRARLRVEETLSGPRGF